METALSFEAYQKALAEGRLLCVRCEECGEAALPPQAVCPGCGSVKMKMAESEKTGEIKTFTVIRVPPEGMEAPYIVAMVELACGAWATGNLVGTAPDEANMELIGKKVTVDSLLAAGDKYAMGDTRVLAFQLA